MKDVAKWLLKPLILQRYTNVLGSTNGSKVYDDLRKLRHGTRGTYSTYLRTTIRAHAVLVLYLIRAPGTYTCFVAGRMYRAKYRLGFGLVLRVKVIATLVFLVGRKIDRCRLFFYKIAIRRLETFLP